MSAYNLKLPAEGTAGPQYASEINRHSQEKADSFWEWFS